MEVNIHIIFKFLGIKAVKTKMGFTTHKNWQNLLILLCVYQKRIFEIDIRKIPNDFIGRKSSQKTLQIS